MNTTTLYERLGGYDAISDEKWRDDALALPQGVSSDRRLVFFRRHGCMKRALA